MQANHQQTGWVLYWSHPGWSTNCDSVIHPPSTSSLSSCKEVMNHPEILECLNKLLLCSWICSLSTARLTSSIDMSFWYSKARRCLPRCNTCIWLKPFKSHMGRKWVDHLMLPWNAHVLFPTSWWVQGLLGSCPSWRPQHSAASSAEIWTPKNPIPA